VTVNKKNIRKWVKALRSGKYKRAIGALRNRNRFCCLGVACDVSQVGEWGVNGYDGRNGTLPASVCEWLGLRSSDPGLHDKRGLRKAASYLNDKRRYTFDEIADAIERTYLTKGGSNA
jgi:hypothetical protein